MNKPAGAEISANAPRTAFDQLGGGEPPLIMVVGAFNTRVGRRSNITT